MIQQIQIAVKITLVGLFFTTPTLAQEVTKKKFKYNDIIYSPRTGEEYNIITKLSNNGTDVPMSARNNLRAWTWFNKPVQNWYIGFGATLYKPLSPFGGSLDVLLVNRAYNITTNVTGVETITNHRLLGLSLPLMFKFRTGDIEKANCFFVNWGTSYNYYFSYKRSINDNKVNDDIKNINQHSLIGVIGVGYEIIPGKRNNDVEQNANSVSVSNATFGSFYNVYLRYNHHFNNVFNSDYIGNVASPHPYKNWSTQVGYLSIGFVIRGSMKKTTYY
jgi:hypothetical protein